MFEDTRPFHDHGSFTAQGKTCSDDKHKALQRGLNPHREGYDKEGNLVNPLLAFFVMYEYMFDNVRYIPSTDPEIYNIECACCRAPLGYVGLRQPEPDTEVVKDNKIVWWQDNADVWEGLPGERTKWIGRFNLKEVRRALRDSRV